MNLTELRSEHARIASELRDLENQPYLIGYWLDTTPGRKEGQTYTRLVWSVEGTYANGKPRKRRRTLKGSEIGEHRAMIDRGHEITQLRAELQQVEGAIADIESKIASLAG